MRCCLVLVFDNCTWRSNSYLLEYFREELLTCIVETRAERCQNELIQPPRPPSPALHTRLLGDDDDEEVGGEK